jgi:hypothetical protein
VSFRLVNYHFFKDFGPTICLPFVVPFGPDWMAKERVFGLVKDP